MQPVRRKREAAAGMAAMRPMHGPARADARAARLTPVPPGYRPRNRPMRSIASSMLAIELA